MDLYITGQTSCTKIGTSKSSRNLNQIFQKWSQKKTAVLLDILMKSNKMVLCSRGQKKKKGPVLHSNTDFFEAKVHTHSLLQCSGKSEERKWTCFRNEYSY